MVAACRAGAAHLVGSKCAVKFSDNEHTVLTLGALPASLVEHDLAAAARRVERFTALTPPTVGGLLATQDWARALEGGAPPPFLFELSPIEAALESLCPHLVVGRSGVGKTLLMIQQLLRFLLREGGRAA